ncbi:hypothetical protein GCM10007415_40170 [Parapedobacter pyrenivorans]|uniref:DUF3037 domain-containing protein n=1 Tax=Parapedobacter pyrenivorans TaxID=1305674 RepID=A0A917I0T8_9SPHI|nr:DUF3037 domain-containing protein [Parapedobacter pyrenivorans]GGH00205.1 hypothetical protein GCM10007415_40170 [Parapedobacter pyrenivorans]
MNAKTYNHALLQYRHSQALGEVMNIGLIAYFPTHRQLAFLYPENLNRLRFAYNIIPEKTIRGYFSVFSKRVEEFNANPGLFPKGKIDESFQRFVENEFLPADSSALQFGQYCTSVLYTDDIEHIKAQLYNQYLSVFQH